MKIQFWAIGKANDKYFDEAIDHYTRRISHYFTVNWRLFPASKNNRKEDAMAAESESLLHARQPGDFLIALDETGEQLNSVQLASSIERQALNSIKCMTFAIGGAYGFSPSFLKKCDFTWSLSPLTFPHQLVRLILAEQIYRACTIMRNEGYHHE